ncbi:MAG: pseudouridine synthase [Candidatus Sumerlaeia bacterium]|nr:pseudouridine synthase [Candidatus Sumerlaeia bacterium]
MTEPHVRLQKHLAACGIGSRRACEDLIREGAVTVNGVVAEIGCSVDPGNDTIALRGKPVLPPAASAPRLWAYHKPPGVTCTFDDAHAERTLRDALPAWLWRESERIIAIGRLDRDSEGLLLLTNDGALAERLTHPRHEVEKEYEVWARPAVSRAALAEWARGVEVPAYPEERAPSGTVVLHAEAQVLSPPEKGRPQLLRVVLREGRKREIRRLVEREGSHVEQLVRIRVGQWELGDLAEGSASELPVPADYLSR